VLVMVGVREWEQASGCGGSWRVGVGGVMVVMLWVVVVGGGNGVTFVVRGKGLV
jgi:hypothetical protein